MIKNFL